MTFILICDFETVGYKTLRHFVRMELVWGKKKQEEILSVCLVHLIHQIHAHTDTHAHILNEKEGGKNTRRHLRFIFFFALSQVSNLLAIYLCNCNCWIFSAHCLSFPFLIPLHFLLSAMNVVCCIVWCQMALIYKHYYCFNFGKLQECTTVPHSVSV